MLTPVAVKIMKAAVESRATSELATTVVPGAVHKLRTDFYKDILLEIAHGSIDPKSLARAALEPEEKF